MKCVSTSFSFSSKSKPFSFEWFRTKTRFETEAKGNSEMAYLRGQCLCRLNTEDQKYHLGKPKYDSQSRSQMSHVENCSLQFSSSFFMLLSAVTKGNYAIDEGHPTFVFSKEFLR